MEDKPTPLIGLSASRTKLLDQCSWQYWANYHIQLPQIQNEGAKKGSICHSVFEVLLKKKHKKHYKQIIKENSIIGSKAVYRMVLHHIRKLKLSLTKELLVMIDQMIMVGLKNDFFIKNGKLVAPEFEFDLSNESPCYRIKGFMDKPVIVGNEIIIDDFKSSKKKFEGEDQESNLQALIYSLAAKKLWPHLSPRVRFIFLQYPDSPIMELKFTDNALKGLEFYLEEIEKKVLFFNKYDAMKNFAAHIEPSPNEFKGKVVCGYAKKPGQLKKDGTKMWHCPYKFPFQYYRVKMKDGKEKTFFTIEEIPKDIALEIKLEQYAGCPAFFSPALDINIKPQPPVIKRNVLDDFNF